MAKNDRQLDRMTQIWGKFEGKTDRRLTGKGIDNIPRPDFSDANRRRDIVSYSTEIANRPMPEGVEDPAQAAFRTLKTRLASYDAKGRKRNQAPLDAPAAAKLDQQLFRDLAATEQRIARRDGDYDTWYADQKAKGRGGRKGGIFGKLFGSKK